MSQYIINNKKAKKFNDDSKLFIASLEDAYKCAKQSAEFNYSNNFSKNAFKFFEYICKTNKIFLFKDYKNLNKNISFIYPIAASDIYSLYTYMLYKQALAIYSNNIHILDECLDFDCLNKRFTELENEFKIELKNTVNNL